MTESISTTLEKRGWLQGALINKEQSLTLLAKSTLIDVILQDLEDKDFDLIVVTQSCNIASDKVTTIQLAIAYHLESRDKQREYNKAPRELDTYYFETIEIKGEATSIERSVRIKILEKVFLPKLELLSVSRKQDVLFAEKEKRSFVDWLGAHYTKPALPTQFNDMIAAQKNKTNGSKKNARKKEKKLQTNFLGVYVNIIPNRDLQDGEQYSVQLLGLINSDADTSTAIQELDDFTNILKDAGMIIQSSVKSENQVSVAVIRNFTRFYLDELSYSENSHFPPDIHPGIN